jgi:hypothetical protein
MSGRKSLIVVVLAAALGVMVLWQAGLCQVGGADTARDIMRHAREKKTGKTEAIPPKQVVETKTLLEASQKVVEAVVPDTPELAREVISAVTGDELLALLPANCIGCVRINSFDRTLGAIDQYILGIAPQPVSIGMLAKMQLSGVIEDPMLTGVNTQGDFAVFATVMPGAAAGEPEIRVGILVPVKAAQFKPQSASIKLVSGNYALLQPESAEIRDSLEAQIKGGSLVGSLEPEEINASRTSPIWGYVNIQKVVEVFGPIAFAKMDEAMKMMPTDPAQAQSAATNMKMAKLYVDFLKKYAAQTKSLSAHVAPHPERIDLGLTFSAVKGSELAGLLVKDPTMKRGYTLAGYLKGDDAVSFAGKTNKALFARLGEISMEMFGDALSDMLPADQVDAWKSMSNDSMKNMGDEFAASFSFAAGMPPVALTEIVEMGDAKASMETIADSMQMINEMYKSMQIPATIAIEPGSVPYNGCDIYSLKFQMAVPPDAPAEQKQMMEAMFKQGFNCKFAAAGKLMLVVVAPDADSDIRKLIDEVKSGITPQPKGDLRYALSTVPNAAESDFVMTINGVRLVKGVGSMLASMQIPGIGMIGQMISQMDVPTTSCICLGGRAADGRARIDIVVPKQHVLEIVSIAAKIKAMMTPPTPPQGQAM